MEPVRPDYDGAWVGALVPALLGQAPPWLPAPARERDRAVLLVLDGLGWYAVRGAIGRLPTLGAMAGGPITTVVPSTTSAALTSISTARAPAAHGVVGYRMRTGGEVLNVLAWRSEGTPPDPATVQPWPPFAGHRLPVVTRSEFEGSGFTTAHLRGARFTGWRTTATLVEHVRRAVVAGEPLVYAYYDGVDKVAHGHGLADGFFDVELAAADRLVADLLAVLPDEVALVVTADHGQVHVGPEGIVGLEPLRTLVAMYSGEGRFRSLHARTGASAELLAAAREHYGDRAWVFSRDELFDGGWLGSGASGPVRGRVGDVVLAAREPVAFADPGFALERRLVSFHGSLTADEMLVPLLAAGGTA